MTLVQLSDESLLASLAAVCAGGRQMLARLVRHLVEIEDRRLHLKAACPSMFDFCVRRLGMSEGEAFRRINAARVARRFPRVIDAIERGEIHLTALVMLRDHLTDANLEELLAAARGRSKRGLEELVALRAPRPDAPALLRKLPSSAATATGSPAPPLPDREAPLAARTSSLPASVSMAASVPLPTAGAVASSMTGRGGATSVPGRIEQLSEGRHRVQVTVSSEVREKLERARDLLRHRNPAGDLAVVVERALDALLERLERERLASAAREPEAAAPAGAAGAGRAGRITAAVRRAVFARDGERCTFTDASGERCPSRTLLELDHVQSRALGGVDAVDNLRVRCRPHNRLHAEEVFGREYVQSRIHFRQQKRILATGEVAASSVPLDAARDESLPGRPAAAAPAASAGSGSGGAAGADADLGAVLDSDTGGRGNES